ncbi:uncharacterized protein [Phyllobates terribilis]|uniref:uncharacterized protein n=1 Tax=Phyllobates terribilis TaxID=111132 RepID=UPI003CCABD7B
MPSVLPPGSELRCPGLRPHPLRHLRGAGAERPQLRGVPDLRRRDPALLQPPVVAGLVLPQPGGLHRGADEGPPRRPQEEAPGAAGEESLQELLQEEPEESGGSARQPLLCRCRPDYVCLHQPQLQRSPGRLHTWGESAGAQGCERWRGTGGQAGVTESERTSQAMEKERLENIARRTRRGYRTGWKMRNISGNLAGQTISTVKRSSTASSLFPNSSSDALPNLLCDETVVYILYNVQTLFTVTHWMSYFIIKCY